jgi:propionate CoA-transferase
LEVAVEDGQLRIVREGRSQKFVARVEQITFSGAFAAANAQPVLYVTERCVLRRTAEGMELVEVAPGIDVERDILGQMGFRPIVRDLAVMDPTLFREAPVGMAHRLLALSLADRISYDSARKTLFINYEGFQIRTTDEVELVRREVETRCRAIGERVAVIVNYDQLYLDPAVSDAFFSMITYLQQRYYRSASRYTTSAFMRLKLGAGLAERELAPHVFETLAEAQSNIARS